MKRVQITRALNKPSIRFVPVFLLPFLSLRKLRTCYFHRKRIFLLSSTQNRGDETRKEKRKRRKRRGDSSLSFSPFQGGFANRPLGIITRHEPRRACLPIAATEEKTRHQIERELVSLSPSVACVPSVPDQNTEAGGPGDKFSSLSSQEDLVTRAYVRPTSPLGRVRDPRVVVRRA